MPQMAFCFRAFPASQWAVVTELPIEAKVQDKLVKQLKGYPASFPKVHLTRNHSAYQKQCAHKQDYLRFFHEFVADIDTADLKYTKMLARITLRDYFELEPYLKRKVRRTSARKRHQVLRNR